MRAPACKSMSMQIPDDVDVQAPSTTLKTITQAGKDVSFGRPGGYAV